MNLSYRIRLCSPPFGRIGEVKQGLVVFLEACLPPKVKSSLVLQHLDCEASLWLVFCCWKDVVLQEQLPPGLPLAMAVAERYRVLSIYMHDSHPERVIP